MRDITTKVISGDLNFSKFSEMKDPDIIDELTPIKGIGNWTAKMYLIFVLDRQDVLPYEDMAFLQAYKLAYKTDDLSPSLIQKNLFIYTNKGAKYCPMNTKCESLTALASDRVSQIIA